MRPVREHAMGIDAAVPIWPAESKGQAIGAPDGFGSEHSLDIDSDSTRAVRSRSGNQPTPAHY
jgi:hypothetical protein